MQLKKFIETTCNKPISECSNQELYLALLSYTKEQIKEKETPCNDKKKLYYISAEFLIGKLLSNNLINLGIYDEVALLLKGNGKSLAEIEEAEPEPSLGNGGLGRLAACFLDSIATLGLPGDGVGRTPGLRKRAGFTRPTPPTVLPLVTPPLPPASTTSM